MKMILNPAPKAKQTEKKEDNRAMIPITAFVEVRKDDYGRASFGLHLWGLQDIEDTGQDPEDIDGETALEIHNAIQTIVKAKGKKLADMGCATMLPHMDRDAARFMTKYGQFSTVNTAFITKLIAMAKPTLGVKDLYEPRTPRGQGGDLNDGTEAPTGAEGKAKEDVPF